MAFQVEPARTMFGTRTRVLSTLSERQPTGVNP